MLAVRTVLFGMLTSPATCGHDVVVEVVQFLPPELASGAPIVSKSTPDDAVLSLEAIVLLMMFTLRASSSATPAPSQPATLFAMMLLVSMTEFQRFDEVGKLTTSEPLMACS